MTTVEGHESNIAGEYSRFSRAMHSIVISNGCYGSDVVFQRVHSRQRESVVSDVIALNNESVGHVGRQELVNSVLRVLDGDSQQSEIIVIVVG